jgi:hypothetical protein
MQVSRTIGDYQVIDVYGWLVGRGNNNTSNDCGYIGNWNLMKNVSYPPTIHPPWCIASYWVHSGGLIVIVVSSNCCGHFFLVSCIYIYIYI